MENHNKCSMNESPYYWRNAYIIKKNENELKERRKNTKGDPNNVRRFLYGYINAYPQSSKAAVP